MKNRKTPNEKKPTQAEILMSIIDSTTIVSNSGEAYAQISDNRQPGVTQVYPVAGRDFKNWLNFEFYRRTDKTPTPAMLSSVVSATLGRARFEGKEQKIYTRIAGDKTRILYDLCDGDWRTVMITPNGWSIKPGTGIFKRNSNMAPMPNPVQGGKIEALKPLVNMSDDDWVLYVAWLVGALCPWGPYPILFIGGAEGSAKTTTANFARALVDPARVLSSAPPRDDKDLVVQAKANRVVSIDNVSYVPGWLSDALCRISVGGGYMVRKLYTDDSLVIFDHQQPVVLNSIGDILSNNDLADRSISLFLPQVPEKERKTQRSIEAEFKRVLPGVFGGLLTSVSMALKRLDETKPSCLARMADFSLWVTAAEPALPWEPGRFMEVYSSNRADQVQRSIENNTFTAAIIDWLGGRGGKIWTGTSKGLLGELKPYAVGRTDSKEWPATPEAVGKKLRRLTGFLARAGIDVDFYREPNSARTRKIKIEYTKKCL